MRYLTAKEVAEKWHVHIRTVQKWAQGGKFEGAQKVGRDWMIPEQFGNQKQQADSMIEETPILCAMPLLTGRFLPGKADIYISGLSEEEQKMAMAEQHYFRGESMRAACLTEELLDSKSYNIRLSALLVHAFANIQLQRIHIVRQDFYMIMQAEKLSEGKVTTQERLFGHYVHVLCQVLLHDTQNMEAPFQKDIQQMPDGLRFYGTYIIAHYYYLRQDYQRSLGIAETALILFGKDFPIGTIYLFLVVAMNLISLKRIADAEIYFRSAWDIAKKDGWIEPFAEHHGLLGGLVEKCLKTAEPKSYDEIAKMVYAFSEGWRQIHNPATDDNVTSDLSTMEFSIAMLASKGWSNKEIEKHLNLSENAVKNITKAIYQKLKINGRKELKKYMLK